MRVGEEAVLEPEQATTGGDGTGGTWFEEVEGVSLRTTLSLLSSFLVMTLFSFVLLLLAPCLIVPGFVAILFYDRRQSSAAEQSREMKPVLKGLRADVGDVDLDARDRAWRRPNWSGPESYVADRLTESSHEVMLLTSYAEALVPVMQKDEEMERRRCSLCLN